MREALLAPLVLCAWMSTATAETDTVEFIVVRDPLTHKCYVAEAESAPSFAVRMDDRISFPTREDAAIGLLGMKAWQASMTAIPLE